MKGCSAGEGVPVERNVPVERAAEGGRAIYMGVPGDLQGLGQKKSPGIRESDAGGTMRKLILR